MAEKEEKLQPGYSWWQSLLLYPTLVLSLAGSMPTIINAVKAWVFDVKMSRVQVVEEQRELWEKNANCLLASAVYSVEVTTGTVLSVTLCPSGDALLRYRITDIKNEQHIAYVWVKYPSDQPAPPVPHLEPESSTEPVVPKVLRSALLYGSIRCNFVSGNVVVQVVTTDGQHCWAEVIRFRDQRTASRTPVSCTAPCFLFQPQG